MKKFVSIKTKTIIIFLSLIICLFAGIFTTVYILSSVVLAQKIKTDFNMYYTAPTPWDNVVYPQTYVGDSFNDTLKNLFLTSSSELMPTGKSYYSLSAGVSCLEYKYDKQKYVRLESATTSTKWLNSTISEYNLTNASVVKGNEYWFKVEPIEWQEKGDLRISAKVLGSYYHNGVQYNNCNSYWNSYIYKYFNNTFANEIGFSKVGVAVKIYNSTYITTSNCYNIGSSNACAIFCASFDELSGVDTKKVATDFARATGTSVSTTYTVELNGIKENTSSYWLRYTYRYYNDYDDNDLSTSSKRNMWYVTAGGSYDDISCSTSLGLVPLFYVKT